MGDSMPSKAIYIHNLFGIMKKRSKKQVPDFKFVYNYRKFGKIADLAESIDNLVDYPKRFLLTPGLNPVPDDVKFTIYVLFWDCDVADVHEEILSSSAVAKLRKSYIDNLYYVLKAIKRTGNKAFVAGDSFNKCKCDYVNDIYFS